jgi:hypothetical protein
VQSESGIWAFASGTWDAKKPVSNSWMQNEQEKKSSTIIGCCCSCAYARSGQPAHHSLRPREIPARPPSCLRDTSAKPSSLPCARIEPGRHRLLRLLRHGALDLAVLVADRATPTLRRPSSLRSAQILSVCCYPLRLDWLQGSCRIDLPGPTTSVGTRTDYSVGPWDYSTWVTRHLMVWGARATVEKYSNRKLCMSCTM